MDVLSANDGLQLKTTGFYNFLDDLITTNPNTGLATAVPYYVNVEKAGDLRGRNRGCL